MYNSFLNMWELLINFTKDIVLSLNNVLIDLLNFDLTQKQFNLILFSDTPILSFNLYELFNIILAVLTMFLILKMLYKVIKMPFDLLTGGRL